MNRLFKSFLIVFTLVFSTNAMAHPGHGTFTGSEIWHYFTSPMHIGAAFGIIVVLLVGYRFLKPAHK